MCFGSRAPEPVPPPAAPAAVTPVLSNQYDPASPESGTAAEKGAISNKAKGTSQVKIDLDPTVSTMDKSTGLQITT